eukprot:2285066-Pyramimonas_sp.AAC.1
MLVCAPLRCIGRALGWCCPDSKPGPTAVDDGVVPEQGGPATSTPVENDFYAQLRAKGADTMPHHLIVQVGGTAARLERPALNTGIKYKKSGVAWPHEQ